jgi:hypothetical protein
MPYPTELLEQTIKTAIFQSFMHARVKIREREREWGKEYAQSLQYIHFEHPPSPTPS